MAPSTIRRLLARIFASAPPDEGLLTERIARAFEALPTTASPQDALHGEALVSQRSIRPLVRRYLKEFARLPRPGRRRIERFLTTDHIFENPLAVRLVRVADWIIDPPEMHPVDAASIWPVPPITSSADLAAWLGLTLGELDWFADLEGRASRPKTSPRLVHYHYHVIAKPHGGLRLIEAPKSRLKALQQRILRGILSTVPVHEAAHGYAKGRSTRSFAQPHTGQAAVLRMDLADFFPTISGVRVAGLFRVMGYPEEVAVRLGGLCSNAAPPGIWTAMALGQEFEGTSVEERIRARDLYRRPHLPQGAPTSPALANLCTYRLDCRLTGLARSMGIHYTRYADDLAFSGNRGFAQRAENFSAHVAAIAAEEGYRIAYRKTRLMRQGVRQKLTGLVVNQVPNIPRGEFDLLKATLTNCVHYGPETQNRQSHPEFRRHLEGRVGYVASVHPVKGERLRRLLKRIAWLTDQAHV